MSNDLPPVIPPENNNDSPATDPLAPAPVGGTGLTPNAAAGLAVVFSLIGGIIFLVVEKRDRFVRYWAMQSVVVGLAYLAFRFLTFLIYFIFSGPLSFLSWIWSVLALLVSVVFLVVTIIMAIKAFTGKQWDVPFLGKISRQQLGPDRL